MDVLKHIWQKAQTGNRAEARRDLITIVRETPTDAGAWLLLALLVDDPAQQAECCRRVLRLDPGNRQATTLLQKLTQPSQPLTTATSLRCPNCQAALDVPADDHAEGRRIICDYCGTTLALTEHGLDIIAHATEPEPPAVEIPELFEYTREGEVDHEKVAELERADLARFVVRELGSEADRNTLIRQVCEQGGMSWPQAEKFVARVALEHDGEIVRRRSPFMAILSVATLIAGVIMALAGAYSVFTYFSPEPGLRLDCAVYLLATGLGMTVGGLIGVVRMVKTLREANG